MGAKWLLTASLLLGGVPAAGQTVDARVAGFGPRPPFLVADLRDGPLKMRLQACLAEPPRRTAFSIGHRGAGLVFPEHTLEAYEAGFRMGAGTLECDVTFTSDLALVCRHSQNDLATTTDILLTPTRRLAVGTRRAPSFARSADRRLSDSRPDSTIRARSLSRNRTLADRQRRAQDSRRPLARRRHPRRAAHARREWGARRAAGRRRRRSHQTSRPDLSLRARAEQAN